MRQIEQPAVRCREPRDVALWTMFAKILPRATVLAVTLTLLACATTPTRIEQPLVQPTPAEPYARVYPYYAESCALTQLGKKSGFGAEIYSGVGGHGALYLNGVCRSQKEPYPVLEMCDEAGQQPDRDGVGLSVNAHYRNAVWVATEGRDFFFNGALAPAARLSQGAYREVQASAIKKGIYGGVDFHAAVFEDMPAGFSPADFRYEISVATDYAIAFGRHRYCARVPVDRSQMVGIVNFLNQINEPYRVGRKVFDWNIFTHNCEHVNHNALAAAGVWSVWPMDRFILTSIFDFPVPKNEFVNLVRRTNDLPIDDLEQMFKDPAARTMLLEHGQLPTQPGALIDYVGMLQNNDVYSTQSKIIFYDQPGFGSYQRYFEGILRAPRYSRLRENLAHFFALYQKIDSEKQSVEDYLREHRGIPVAQEKSFREFHRRYYEYVDRQLQEVEKNLAHLNRASQ